MFIPSKLIKFKITNFLYNMIDSLATVLPLTISFGATFPVSLAIVFPIAFPIAHMSTSLFGPIGSIIGLIIPYYLYEMCPFVDKALSATLDYIFSKSYPLCRNICEKLKNRIFNSSCRAISTRYPEVHRPTIQDLFVYRLIHSYNEALRITPDPSSLPLPSHVYVQNGDVEISLLGESYNEHNIYSLKGDPPPVYTREVNDGPEISLLGESCNEHDISLPKDPPPTYTREVNDDTESYYSDDTESYYSCESGDTHNIIYPHSIKEIGSSSTHSREI